MSQVILHNSDILSKVIQYMDDYQSLIGLSIVSHGIKDTCDQIISKQLLDYCYVEYDGWEKWSLHSISDVMKRMKNHADMKKIIGFNIVWPLFGDTRGRILLATDTIPGCGFVTKRSDILKIKTLTDKQKICECMQ
jgi:hypothetical protein